MAPITVHPENPHYFLWRDRAAVLVTSGEHYGAVLNADIDFSRYLDELQRCGFNLTRTFSGVYREVEGSFKIERNPLAPAPGRHLCPWARSDQSGAADGGNKFDLSRWDEAYFARLKDFVAEAGRRGIVVELVLFCPFYGPEHWDVCPMNAANNTSSVGGTDMDHVYTLEHDDLTGVETAMVRKIVTELNAFDNLYWEICNEPYIKSISPKTSAVSDGWQEHVAATIAETESRLPARHLIAQNIANGSCRIERPNPAVSVLNFHYSNPPDSLVLNRDLARPVAFDETGFRGRDDLPYRCDGWEFLIAGGAVYSHLDYSFTASHPDGTYDFKASPSGGGPRLRRQLSILKEFIDGFDLTPMRPANEILIGHRPEGVTLRALAVPGKAYAFYIRGDGLSRLVAVLPPGRYEAEWVNTATGEVDAAEALDHAGGAAALALPAYSDDVALRVSRM